MSERARVPGKRALLLLMCSGVLLLAFKQSKSVNVVLAVKGNSPCDDFVDEKEKKTKLSKKGKDDVEWRLVNKCGGSRTVEFEWDDGVPVANCTCTPADSGCAIDKPFVVKDAKRIVCVVTDDATVDKTYPYHIVADPSGKAHGKKGGPLTLTHELDIGITP